MSGKRARAERKAQQHGTAHQGHEPCWHILGPPFLIQLNPDAALGAKAEFCCWCAPVRLLLAVDRPDGDHPHGPGIVFAGGQVVTRPTVATPPPPKLIVPGVLH